MPTQKAIQIRKVIAKSGRFLRFEAMHWPLPHFSAGSPADEGAGAADLGGSADELEFRSRREIRQALARHGSDSRLLGVGLVLR